MLLERQWKQHTSQFAFVVVPSDLNANVLFCVPVDFVFVFVFFADDAAVKMIDTGFVYIVDAKVVDDKRERDISGFVTE